MTTELRTNVLQNAAQLQTLLTAISPYPEGSHGLSSSHSSSSSPTFGREERWVHRAPMMLKTRCSVMLQRTRCNTSFYIITTGRLVEPTMRLGGLMTKTVLIPYKTSLWGLRTKTILIPYLTNGLQTLEVRILPNLGAYAHQNDSTTQE